MATGGMTAGIEIVVFPKGRRDRDGLGERVMSQRRECLVIEALGDGEPHWDLRILAHRVGRSSTIVRNHRKCLSVDATYGCCCWRSLTALARSLACRIQLRTHRRPEGHHVRGHDAVGDVTRDG